MYRERLVSSGIDTNKWFQGVLNYQQSHPRLCDKKALEHSLLLSQKIRDANLKLGLAVLRTGKNIQKYNLR